MKGPEYSKESRPELALQLPEAEEVLLLDGEVAATEEPATTGVCGASDGMLGVEVAILIVEVVVGDWAGPQGPH